MTKMANNQILSVALNLNMEKGKTSNDNIAGNAISFNKSSESNHIAIRFWFY